MRYLVLNAVLKAVWLPFSLSVRWEGRGNGGLELVAPNNLMVMICTLKQDNKRRLFMLFISGAFTLQPGFFCLLGMAWWKKVLKLSEIPFETFTLFFTSEVYVAFLWLYTSDRTINIKKLQVTQGPNCQLKLSWTLISTRCCTRAV